MRTDIKLELIIISKNLNILIVAGNKSVQSQEADGYLEIL
jgi:hypothetical protein